MSYQNRTFWTKATALLNRIRLCFGDLRLWENFEERFLKDSPCFEGTINRTPRIMSSHLDNVKDWEEQAVRAKYRVSTLAKMCSITERQLRRYFQEKFRSAPYAWITKRRLKRIKSLLVQDVAIKQLAIDAGFSQTSNFSRLYKKFYGTTPSSTRLSNKRKQPAE